MTPTAESTPSHEEQRVNASRNAWWKLYTLFITEAVRDREIRSVSMTVVEYAAVMADTALAHYEARWKGSVSDK